MLEIRQLTTLGAPSFATRPGGATQETVDTAVASEATIRQAADITLQSSIDAVQAAYLAADLPIPSLVSLQYGRPGDAPYLFTNSLAGGDYYASTIVIDFPIPPLPAGAVTGYQFQRALSTLGDWNAAFGGLPDVGNEARIQWDSGAPVATGDALFTSVKTTLGASTEYMSDLMALAGTY